TATIVISVFLVALLAVVIALAVVTESFIVDGTSMLPYLSGGKDNDYNDGDKVIVDKVKKVKRGNIVVATIASENKTLIKRAVAVGGDKVKIVDGVLYVNGVKESGEYLSKENKIMYSGFSPLQVDEFTVKNGYVYLLGDNRNVSHDSRSIGQISLDEINGVAFMIVRENKTLEIVKY
ncbi:MAG: signal peptidase I, partial [Eubacteriales bacterium]|nr:signal peptidase I [Eubacteriales bacterium]